MQLFNSLSANTVLKNGWGITLLWFCQGKKPTSSFLHSPDPNPSHSTLSAHSEQTAVRTEISVWNFIIDITDHFSFRQVWRVFLLSSIAEQKAKPHRKYTKTHIWGDVWTLGHWEEESPFSPKQFCVRVLKTQITITSLSNTYIQTSFISPKQQGSPLPYTHRQSTVKKHLPGQIFIFWTYGCKDIMMLYIYTWIISLWISLCNTNTQR